MGGKQWEAMGSNGHNSQGGDQWVGSNGKQWEAMATTPRVGIAWQVQVHKCPTTVDQVQCLDRSNSSRVGSVISGLIARRFSRFLLVSQILVQLDGSSRVWFSRSGRGLFGSVKSGLMISVYYIDHIYCIYIYIFYICDFVLSTNRQKLLTV